MFSIGFSICLNGITQLCLELCLVRNMIVSRISGNMFFKRLKNDKAELFSQQPDFHQTSNKKIRVRFWLFYLMNNSSLYLGSVHIWSSTINSSLSMW